MSKLPEVIWKLTLALLGFAICLQVVWSIIQPFLPFIAAGIAIFLVGWVVVRLRRYYAHSSGGGGHDLIRGR